MEFKRSMFSSFMFLFMVMSLCSGSRLNHFDKTPVKSITSRDGDVIDCVDINRQPAFEHPLLKNHELQIIPSNRADKAKKDDSITQSWQLDGACPDGTIAMRRITLEKVARANSINNDFLSSFRVKSTVPSDSQFQVTTVVVEEGEYFGGKAIVNLWEPNVRPNEISSSYMVLVGGTSPELFNAIAAGWQVLPKQYGDNRTRFYAAWLGANSTGCLNLECPGFVQISNEIALGATFPLLSSIDGPQFEFSVTISMGDKGWMLQFNDTIIGYWPYSLFTTLAMAPASSVQWGGMIFNSQVDGKQSTTTQMGSGHFAEEGFGRSSYMRQLQVTDRSLKYRGLDSARVVATEPNCYDIELSKSELWGDFFYFGGPGRNPKCP